MPDFLDPVVLPANATSALHAVTKQQMDVADVDLDALAVGEETISRGAFMGITGPTTTQNLRLTYFRARESETTTQVRMISGGTAAGVSPAPPTVCQIALYSIDGSGNGTLVANTTHDSSLFGAANTTYTKSWASSYAKVAGQMYAVAVLVVTAATAPTITGTVAQTGLPSEWAIDPRITGVITGQATLPGTFTAGSVATSTVRMYAAILP